MTADGAPGRAPARRRRTAAGERLPARPAGAAQGPAGAAPRAPRPGRRRALAGARRRRAARTRAALAQRNALLARDPRRPRLARRRSPPGTRELARHGARAVRRPRRGGRAARRAVRRARRASSGSSGEVDARLPPALAAPTTRRSSSPSSPSALDVRPRARLHRPRAAPRRARAPARRPRAARLRLAGRAAPRRCWRCCSPSASVLAAERGRTPLMLLDDVMSELDADAPRAARRASCARGGQSVITTTDLAHVPGAEDADVARLRDRRRARRCRRPSPRWSGRGRAPRPAPVAAALERARPPALAPADAARARSRRPGRAAAGEAIAAAPQPGAERDGVVTVTCEAAVWAQELDLMPSSSLERLERRRSGAAARRAALRGATPRRGRR